jgi:asparaginyl-tRNA synthetase
MLHAVARQKTNLPRLCHCSINGQARAQRARDPGCTPPSGLGPQGRVAFGKDFFGREALLTVSGQLNVEAYCLALTKVYTLGPTFRAENSNISRHGRSSG